jgi:oxygen-independent coproporphyrinogen-3 oxidase
MRLLSQAVEFDLNLLRKYDRPVPRYTSYPPATELKEEFREIDFKTAIAVSNYKKTPLSLYCHIPFCETACYFCGCNTVITQRKEVAEPYLDYIRRDIKQMAELIDRDRLVNQLHWGGGTPNYLSPKQVETLWETINHHFTFAPEAEISIEVNPRYLDKNYIFFLRDLGFKRISFGIQDFNPKVQEAVNRIQPEAMLFEAMEWIRDAGFESVNVDLIYGLPYQNLDTFKNTIRKTVQLNPDRIAVFNFAKPNDELAIAQQEGELHRNFQGYTTKPESDLLSFGMTSISMLHDVYVQNHKKLKRYYQAIDNRELPIERGVTLSRDDIIRRTIIMELMCQFQLSKYDIEEKYHLSFDLDFEEYFAEERYDLRLLEADGLIHLSHDQIQVTPSGRLLIRNIASAFDKYLRTQQTERFSKAV